MARSCPEENIVNKRRFGTWSPKILSLLAIVALAGAPSLSPAYAQVATIDPNDAIDADLETPDFDGTLQTPSEAQVVTDTPIDSDIAADIVPPSETVETTTQDQTINEGQVVANVDDATTYQDDDLIGAAEGGAPEAGPATAAATGKTSSSCSLEKISVGSLDAGSSCCVSLSSLST